MGLDGWTRVGDQIEGNGRWILYRYRAVSLASLETLEVFAPEETVTALKAYKKRAKNIMRGGLWLVDPRGVVCEVTFIR
jgi:hypothetical protein